MFKLLLSFLLFFPILVNALGVDDYTEVSWEKFWNVSYIKDYDGKQVKFKAKWIGLAEGQVDASANAKPYVKGGWVQVGLQKFNGEKISYAAFIKKEKIDKILDSLKEGEEILVAGLAYRVNYGGAWGTAWGGQNAMTLQIEKIYGIVDEKSDKK